MYNEYTLYFLMFSGILIGPYVMDLLPEIIMEISEEIRLFVLLIILFKAGLGLDKEKLMAKGSVAIRLGFLPAIIETLVITFATRWLLGWNWLISFILGWIICAASPAVIVPMMLKLKAQGWGVKKGIPDLILAGGTTSDAVAVTMFGITTAWILGEISDNLWIQLGSIPFKIILGIIIGYVAGKLVLFVTENLNLTENIVQEIIIGLSAGVLLILGEHYIPYSDYLAVMVMGFVILEKNTVTARRLRKGLDSIWQIGEIFLFVLIGAAVNINIIYESGLIGLLIIVIGLILGRTSGILLSLWGSDFNTGERDFMIIGQTAKATVQAAIGGIPLALGIEHGQIILAIAVLSILFTAPLGAFGTSFFAPRLLKKGKIDPTKITVQENYNFLVAIDGSAVSLKALKEAARIARQVDGKLIVLNVFDKQKNRLSKNEIEQELLIARDIEHEIIIDEGKPAEIIKNTALNHDIDYIYIGKSNKKSFIGNVTEKVIEKTSVPVILIDNGNT